MPEYLKKKFMETTRFYKGVYRVEGEVWEWLKKDLKAAKNIPETVG
jgi:hypothetical protein